MSSLPPPPGQPPSEPSWPSYPSPGGAGPAPAPGYGPPPSFPGGGYGTPSSPPGGMPPGFQPYGTQGNARASFGQRLGALIVDFIVNLVIMAPFLAGLYFLLDKALENCFTITKANGDKKLECPDGALQVGPLVAAIVIGVIGLISDFLFKSLNERLFPFMRGDSLHGQVTEPKNVFCPRIAIAIIDGAAG